MALPEVNWATNDGIYLGHKVLPDPDISTIPAASVLDLEWNQQPERWRFKSDGHVFTLGPNGCGKTRRLLIPNLCVLKDWSILVVDPKGSLAVKTAMFRKDEARNHVITLDPFGVIERDYPALVAKHTYLRSAGLNPLASLNPDDEEFPDEAKALGEALIKVDPKDSQPHFATSAQILVAGLIMGLRVSKGPSASLRDLRRLIGGKSQDLADFARAVVSKFGGDYEELESNLSGYTNIGPDDKELSGIINTARTQTSWLDSRRIKADLERGNLDFRKVGLKSKPTTIYLVLPPRYLESHSTWLRLMITAVLTPQLRTLGSHVPILFMLDEFAQLGRLEVIERNMAVMREYGVKLWPVFQDLSQAKDVYERRWESFVGNAGIVQSFAPQDDTTRDYLSKLSGQRMYWLATSGSSTSQNTGPQHSTTTGMTEGTTPIQGPNLWGIGLGRMEKGQAILFNGGWSFRTMLPDPSVIPRIARILEAAEREARAA